MKTQRDAILAYLKAGHPLTHLDAFLKFGCNRLAARVLELRQAGHEVKTRNVSHRGKHYAEYRL